jgi:ArsR family transcriptional regulator
MTAANERAADLAAKLFHGFADRTRMAILLTLLDGEHRVTDLVDATGRSQATVSEHLACLRGCGLVESRAEGRQSYYQLASSEIMEMLLAAQQLLRATGERVRLCPAHLEPQR